MLGVEDRMKPHEPRGMEILKPEPASQEFAQIYDICVGGKGQIDALLGCHCSGHCQSVIWNPYALVQRSSGVTSPGINDRGRAGVLRTSAVF